MLLCSLLLGFGLDAYVCIGTVKDNSGNERDHLWVITRIRPGTSRSRVIFWESLTGQRYPHRFTPPESGQDAKNPSGSSSSPSSTSSSDPAAPKYGVVGCVFNHRKFYANKQINDAVAHTNFTFEDSRLWKGMDSEILGGMEHQESVPLCPPTISVPTLEASLERSLMVMITSMRRNESARDEVG